MTKNVFKMKIEVKHEITNFLEALYTIKLHSAISLYISDDKKV